MADGMLMISQLAPSNYRWLLEQSKRNGTSVHSEAARYLDRAVTEARTQDEAQHGPKGRKDRG